MPNNLTDAEENRLLDLSLVAGDLLALVTTAGTDAAAGTEVAGGSYARQPLTWAAASGGSKTTSAAVSYSSLPACRVQGWAVYSSGGTRKWYGVLSPKTGTAQNTGDTITVTAHGKANGDMVVFQSGYAPAGLAANTTYFVVGATANTFQVSATLGGSVLPITADAALIVVGSVLDVPAGAGVTLAAGAVTCSMA